MHRYGVQPWHLGGPEVLSYAEIESLMDAEEERQRQLRKQRREMRRRR